MKKTLIKISRFIFLFLIFHAALFFCAPYSYASAPAGYSEYFIPGDEDIMGQVWADIGAAGPVALTAPRHTIISVVAWSTDTTLYYDHWEDGYDFDPDNPATADETYTLANKGDSRIFESSNIPVNPRGVATYYDGRDRIYVAGGAVTVTRSSWEDTDGTVFALAWEVYPVKPQMIKYIMPFGDDLSVAPRIYLDFKRVFALIQATKNNTVVTFDVNKDGVSGDTICITHNNPCTTTATQVTLNQGEVFLLDRFAPFPTTGTVSLQTGTVMQSTETLQVNYIVGDQAANFEARGFSAFPSGMWDNEYYAPVPTDAGANFPTQLYVFNPHSTALTINYQTSTTSGSFSVPAGSTLSFSEMTGGYVPQGSGVYLNASDVFWGVSTIDVGGQSREWGYPLIPLFLIGNEHFFGWAPGAYPPNVTGNQDDSGIFITPVQDNTRVFVDRNNDGTVDYTYTLNRLQTQYVYDSVDGDMSNSNVWATGPISIAYGQNPDTSVAGLPSIDLGYLSFPGGDFIDKVLTVTKTANPVVVSTTAGATSTYTLTVNSHDFSVDGISVTDFLPAGWQYVTNSSHITLADMTTLSGAPAEPLNSSPVKYRDNFGTQVYNNNADNLPTGTNWTTNWIEEGEPVQSPTLDNIRVVQDGALATYALRFMNNSDAIARMASLPSNKGITLSFDYRRVLTATTQYVDVEVCPNATSATPITCAGGWQQVVRITSTTTDSQYLHYQADLTSFLAATPVPANFAIRFSSIGSTGGATNYVWFDNIQVAADIIWPSSLLGGMAENQTITITFDGQTTQSFSVGDITRNTVQATGTRTVGGATQTFVTSDFAFNSYGDITVTKTSSATDPLYPGDQFTYTVTVTNPVSAPSNLTGVAIYDPLPEGVSYVAASGLVTCERLLNVRDEFATVAYTNNGPNNTANWADNWTETDSLGGGAASGLVQITAGGQLRLGPSEFVRDEFSAAAYTNNNGSINWAGNWTETDSYGGGATGAAGGFVYATGTQLQFRYLLSNVRDEFTTDNSYGGNYGSNNWAGNWTEENDAGAPDYSTGTIRLSNGNDRVEFTQSQITDAILRAATVTGATSATINFALTDNGIDAGETVIAEYRLDAGGYVNIGTLDGGAGWTWGPGGAIPLTIALAGNNTITIRFRAGTNWNQANDIVRLDNVDISFNVPANSTGTQIQRTANLAGATSAVLTFNYTAANLEAGDTLVVEASSDGSSFTILETLDGPTGTGTKTYNLISPPNYASATTTIRLSVTSGFNVNNETFSIDNFNILYQVTPPAIQRTANLTGAVNPLLNFSYTAANLEAGDTLVLEVSTGGSFAALATFAGGTPSVAPPYDLTLYISANTTIRFRITGGYDVTNETLSFDNVDISYYLPSTFASGNPPEFLSNGNGGCRIQPGNSLTLTFDVTVDNPLGTGISEITNTAFINSNEIVLPISASVTNLVVNPSSQSAEVGDFVWFDTDGDGIQDVGEPGLANVEVTLRNWLGAPIATTTTDNGHFLFTNIEPGNGYYIEVTAGTIPAGLQQSAPAGHSDNRTDPFDLTAGQSYMNADLGYRTAPGTAAIGDLVWSDPNSNSLNDPGEPGLPGVTVQLWQDTNSNGLLDGTDTLCTIVLCGTNGTTITAPNGYYLFAGVTSSGTEDYLVYIDGTQAALSGYTILSNTRIITNLGSGSTVLSADFGYQGTTYTIIDKLWFDVDADGLLDGGETGISLVTVDLLDASMNVIATTITDASGNYTFSGVAGGGADYTIRISDTNGKLNDYFGTTASAIAGEMQIINLSGNLDYTASPNFGYGLNQTIGSTIFNDVDGDGTLDSGELGISGVTVKLYNDCNGDGIINSTGCVSGSDSVVATLITDANGIYLFTGLSDGNYIVSIETPPAGYTYTGTDSDGGTPGHQQAANISGGSSVLTKNFGYEADDPRSVSGSIWDDTDGDGTIDASETGLENVTIDLMQGAVVISSTTTAADGSYSFSGVASGTYTVTITDTNGILSGFTQTYEYDGTLNGQVTLDISTNPTGINFGYKQPTPTLVSISSFRTYQKNGMVAVEWSTSSETDTAGFYLYRLDKSSGKYRQINELLLPAMFTSLQGGTYSLIDEGASAVQENTYKLVEMEGQGRRNIYGPFSVYPEGEANATGSGHSVIMASGGTSLVQSPILGANSVETIRTYTDKDGTIVITNKTDSGQKVVNVDRYTFSNYTRTPNSISADRQIRISALNEEKRSAKNIKTGIYSNSAKFPITSDGLYYIEASKIAEIFGITNDKAVSMINHNEISLTNRGFNVAYIPDEGNTAIFFYGQAIDSIYTKENIYWLHKNKKGLRMKYIVENNPAPVQQASFADSVHAEQNNIVLPNSYMNPDEDYWFWDYVYTGYGLEKKTFNIDIKGVADVSSDATLTVKLQGFTETGVHPDHHVRISINNHIIEVADKQDFWDGTEAKTLVLTFDQGLLFEGANSIEVEALKDTGAPYSMFYINSFDLAYQRLYEASGDSLAFNAENNPVVSVYGYTSPDIFVFNITDPQSPSIYAATAVNFDGESYSVSLIPVYPAGRYLAATADTAVTVTDISADTPSNLKSKKNRTDYIIITPEHFISTAQSLSDYRNGKRLSTMIISVEDIMDEFNYGISSPLAIRDFLMYAHLMWKNPPKYVVLAGDATYDYRDNLDKGENLVPTLIVSTPLGLFPSDNSLVDTDGDHLPDMSIGRLPVLTTTELQDVINKIITYEAVTANRILMLADDPDDGGSFPEDSNDIYALIPPAYPVKKIYLTITATEPPPFYPITTARQMLIDEINKGTLLMNYIGHAGPDRLAQLGPVEALLRSSDVGLLTNNNKYNIFTAMTCSVGQFAIPGYDSLSELLFLKKDGGSVAVWAPAGLSLNDLSKILDNGFFTAAFRSNNPVLGDVIRQSFTDYKAQGGPDYIIDIYNLQGDPALRMW